MGIDGTNGSPTTMEIVEGLTESSLSDSFRKLMGVADKWAYFDHAAVGPIPTPAATAIKAWADQACCDGDVPWMDWSNAARRTRSLGAELLHCTPDEIGLIPNTTFGINIVAQGFRWSVDRKQSVVVLENEFPSNYLPWIALERIGVEVRRVPVPSHGAVDLDLVAKAIDDSTRIVTASWVGYASGYRLDVAKLCDLVHERGAQLFLDAIQGLGVFTLDLGRIPVDYLAADGHKWMLGPEGAGFLFVRRQNLEFLQPMMTGWGSVVAASQFDSSNQELKPNASRYEGGSANHVGLIGLGASLQMLIDLGCNRPVNPVAKAVLANANVIQERLLGIEAQVVGAGAPYRREENRSGILSFEVPGADPLELRKHLLRAGVVVSVRHNRLRVATHAYNNGEDIDRMCGAIRSYPRHQG